MTSLVDIKLTEDTVKGHSRSDDFVVGLPMSVVAVITKDPASLRLTMHQEDADSLVSAGHFEIVATRMIQDVA